MRRVIGIDTHRTFGEVVIWEDGRLRHAGRVDMTRTALEGFGKSLLVTDEVVIEATGNCMAVSRVLSPFVKRVIIANPLQVKAIAHAHVKTDKVDAGTLASLYAAGYLPEIWTPDAATERMRRLVARRYQVVRHRTRIKNEVMLLCRSRGIGRWLQQGRSGAEVAENLAGDIALEAADNLELGFALAHAAADVSEGGRMTTHPDDHHSIESRIGLPVAAAVEPMSDCLAA